MFLTFALPCLLFLPPTVLRQKHCPSRDWQAGVINSFLPQCHVLLSKKTTPKRAILPVWSPAATLNTMQGPVRTDFRRFCQSYFRGKAHGREDEQRGWSKVKPRSVLWNVGCGQAERALSPSLKATQCFLYKDQF